MNDVERRVRERLFAMRDEVYREFHSKLMPSVGVEAVIGVRTPELRKFAKEYGKTPDAEAFLEILPHFYYEENNLHGFLIAEMKDYDACMAAVQRFLPYVDNWATCDMLSPKVFKKHRPELLTEIRKWLGLEQPYTVRFAIGMLMSHFLDEDFDREYLELVAAVRSREYYVNMMIAWYFATALAKQYEAAAPYIEKQRLDTWTHNKAIQKAVESYRVSDEQKAYLRTLRVTSRSVH